MSVEVEIHGLEVFGRHGVNEEERRTGQTFLIDVEYVVDEPAADELPAAVDYRAVRDVVRAVFDAEVYSLIETLAGAAADALVAALPVRSVRVRVRKPGITWAEWTAASVERVSGS
jgi:7,8-dihydroneopterin aldolase/epimerase/oxygenase